MKIGEVAGVKVCVSPEQFEEIKKQKLIEENKILKEQQKEIERLNNIIKEVREYIKEDRLYMSNGKVLSIANTGCGQKLLEILDKADKGER